MEIDKIIKKDVLEFMETIPDNKIDLIVTDPPYLINYKTNWRKEKHKFSNVIKNDNNPELIKEYIKECYRSQVRHLYTGHQTRLSKTWSTV